MRFFIYIVIFLNSFLIYSQDTISFYFQTNKFELSDREKKRLSDWVAVNTTSKILAIHGFTDEVGSTGYNDTLAQKRVSFIYGQIENKVKIREDFKTISFGENFIQDIDKAKNRRASIYYLKEADLHKENEVLGIPEEIKEVEIPDNLPLHEKIALANVGTKIVLKNINFYQNTFAITPESNEALYDLLFVMQNNPGLRIQIQGHICCIDIDRRNLSLDRAKQVRRFLVFKGIQQHRITVTGFGTTQPIYPIPEENEQQAAENRRVEIEILSKR
ncbi:OmpA family protein [Flavobacterium chuncheonense]|uniref:OmpA family protein n=1 Tax=Flavobacterium chuncheonense TaxID=2026653 RepID=A0ABW5YPI1_9FLAO